MRKHEDKDAPGVPDAESPEVTAAQFRRARPMREWMAEQEAKARRGRGKQKAPTKKAIHIRLDPDVLERYQRTGRGWQSRINDDLKKAAKRLPARERR
jgi:uncharacterized protein (DUF4415 family)